ncbi:MAG: FHA domain-containing protein [Bacillota bacterium]|nr:FHA domain-containing protein [Bacillota bacterium]
MFGILYDSNGEEALRIREGQEFIFGRELPEGAKGFVVNDIFASRNHAVLTFKKEFYLKDLDSKNGSFINERQIISGVSVPLEDGDMLRFGKSEFKFRIGDRKPDKRKIGGFVCSMRNSAGGRRFQVELPGKGCIEYQLRMIEENRELGIADIIHVNSIERDSFLYDVGGYLSLSGYMEMMGRIDNPVGLIEKILKAVEKGEEHLLERSKYLINEETLFIGRDEEILLIYVPCTEAVSDEFAADMEKLCRYFADGAENEERYRLDAAASAFAEREARTGDYAKNMFNFLKNKTETESPEKPKKKGGLIKKEYVFTLISYLIFLGVFWADITDAAGLCGIFVILAGINILFYEIPGGKLGKKKENFLKFNKNKERI